MLPKKTHLSLNSTMLVEETLNSLIVRDIQDKRILQSDWLRAFSGMSIPI